MILALAALLLSCAHNQGWAARLLDLAPLQYLGEISYSLYMLQAPAFFAALEMRSQGIVTDPAALGALLAVLSFAMAIPVSRFIEYPARALIKGMLRTRTAPTSL